MSLAVGPLRERQFRLLFSGQAISVIGDGIVPIALAFAVLDLTHGSVTDLGLVLAAGYLPLVGFLLIGGVWADRLSRRALMLGADIVRAATQAIVAVLLITGTARLWELVVLQVVFGTATAFFRPAATGLVPATVSEHRLLEANALLGMSNSLGFTIGPALGGVLVGAIGTGPAFAVDAATYVWSALFLAALRPRRLPAVPPQPFLRDLVEGFREVRARVWLWTSILYIGLTMMIEVAPFQVLGPLVARRALGGAPAWAAIEAAFGAGTVAGGALALRLRPRRPLLFVNLGFVLAAPSSFLLGWPAPLSLIVIAQFVTGCSVGLYIAIWETLLQRQIPPGVLSRVSAYDWMGSLVFMPVGLALAGPVASLVGVRTTLYAGGIFSIIAIVAILAIREVRTLTTTPPAAPDLTNEALERA